jgi:hypothetical protein
MLSWQSRLDKDWEFEVLIQHVKGAGRGHGFKNTYYEPETEEGVFLIKIALADKLEEVAQRLRGEARSEKDEAFSEALRDHDWERALGFSKAVSEAGFDTVRGKISGLGRAVEFLVVTGPSKIALAEDRAEPARAAYEYEADHQAEDRDEDQDEEYSEASDYMVETDDSQVRQPGLSRFRFFNLGGQIRRGSGVKWKDEDDEETVSGSSRVE